MKVTPMAGKRQSAWICTLGMSKDTFCRTRQAGSAHDNLEKKALKPVGHVHGRSE